MIDINKNYETRIGSRARIYATDGTEDFPIHGAIDTHEGWHSVAWSAEGSFFNEPAEHEYDLIEIPSPSMADES